jgi:hypothetical protein
MARVLEDPVITVMIQAAATTWTRVRFQGSPRML